MSKFWLHLAALVIVTTMAAGLLVATGAAEWAYRLTALVIALGYPVTIQVGGQQFQAAMLSLRDRLRDEPGR